MTLSEFLTACPEFRLEQTGGGCTALVGRISRFQYVLITADSDAIAPYDGCESIDVALYIASESDLEAHGAMADGEPADSNSFDNFEDAAIQIDTWKALPRDLSEPELTADLLATLRAYMDSLGRYPEQTDICLAKMRDLLWRIDHV